MTTTPDPLDALPEVLRGRVLFCRQLAERHDAFAAQGAFRDSHLSAAACQRAEADAILALAADNARLKAEVERLRNVREESK